VGVEKMGGEPLFVVAVTGGAEPFFLGHGFAFSS
jgi:hypothetical protein